MVLSPRLPWGVRGGSAPKGAGLVSPSWDLEVEVFESPFLVLASPWVMGPGGSGWQIPPLPLCLIPFVGGGAVTCSAVPACCMPSCVRGQRRQVAPPGPWASFPRRWLWASPSAHPGGRGGPAGSWTKSPPLRPPWLVGQRAGSQVHGERVWPHGVAGLGAETLLPLTWAGPGPSKGGFGIPESLRSCA